MSLLSDIEEQVMRWAFKIAAWSWMMVLLVGCAKGASDAKSSKSSKPAKSAAVDENEELVRETLRQNFAEIVSDDPETRLQAMEMILPTKKDLAVLFGDEDANKIWPTYSKALDMMRKNTDKAKAEVLKSGKITEIKVRNIRQGQRFKRFDDLLAVIPQSIPIYEVDMFYSNGSNATTGPFVIIDKRAILAREIEMAPRFLQMQAKKEK